VLSFFISELGQEPDGTAVIMRSLEGHAVMAGVIGYPRHFFFFVLPRNVVFTPSGLFS